MKRFISLLLSLTVICAIATADNEYDGLYERPTYFPTFEPPHDWPNNMTYLVEAFGQDGQKMENYEVAVYDQQNQLRATGRSRAHDQQRCMLVIKGENGDEFHFKVVSGDFEHPVIMPALETCKFKSNAVNPSFRLTLTTLPGDANQDGNVDVADLMSIRCYLLGDPTVQTFCLPNADIDDNGEVDDDDVEELRLMMLGTH